MSSNSKFTLMLVSALFVSACSNNTSKQKDPEVQTGTAVEADSLKNIETVANQKKLEPVQFNANNYHEVPMYYFERRSIASLLGTLKPGSNLNGENSNIYTELVHLISATKGITTITNDNQYVNVYSERNPVKRHDNAKQLLIDAKELVKDVKDVDYIKVPISSAELPPPDFFVFRYDLHVDNSTALRVSDSGFYNAKGTSLSNIRLQSAEEQSSITIPINEQQAADIIRNSPAEITGYAYISIKYNNEIGKSEYKVDHIDLNIKGDGKDIVKYSANIN